jgi:ABC-type polysaccharide/polyol phosphate transport system ATPase subunit
MISPKIEISKLSLEFTVYKNKSLSLKESLINTLRFKNKNKVERFLALQNINLNINEGDSLGIIGLNGAGKSSLLKILSKIYTPTKGQINIVGKIAPLIEIGAGFHPELSGFENIYLNGSIMGMKKNEIADKIKPIIDFTGLEQFIHMPIKYYSTGMFMRLSFVVATEINPDILIVDELFAGGDLSFIEKATKRLEELYSKAKILIVVSHNLDYIIQLCKRAILLNKGKVIMDDSPEKVVNFYTKNVNSLL